MPFLALSRRLGQRVAAVPRTEWHELLLAQRALVVAQLHVWTRPVGQLVAPSGAEATPAVPHVQLDSSARADLAAAFRLGRAVRRAAKYGVLRPKCLAQSLALVRLCEQYGLCGARIRVGVLREEGRLRAHAWVEYRGRVIGDEVATVSTFTPLVDMRGASDRTFALSHSGE